MKIALISMRFPPKWIGGTEIASMYLAENLAMLGNRVYVITSWDPNAPFVSRRDGYIVIRVKRPFLERFDLLTIIGNFYFYLKAIKILKKLNPDVIHIQGLTHLLMCVLIKKILNKKCVIWAQGSDIYSNWPFKELLFNKFLNTPDVLILLSTDMLLHISRYRKKDIRILPNGIDLSEFDKINTISKKQAREMLNLPRDSNIILYVGRLEYIKGVHLLLLSFKKIIKKLPDSLLVIIGDGTQKNFLKKLSKRIGIEHNVIFLGFVPREKVLTYMRAADVLVLPSIHEGFGLVLLEAMAAQLPVVATRFGGPTDFIRDEVNGLIVNPLDINELSSKVIRLIEDKKLRNKIAKNISRSINDYTWRNISLKLLEIYKSLF